MVFIFAGVIEVIALVFRKSHLLTFMCQNERIFSDKTVLSSIDRCFSSIKQIKVSCLVFYCN